MNTHESHSQINKDGEKGSATFCREGCHRYTLYRPLLEVVSIQRSTWKGALNFIMLNPSTADQDENDPTITRCMGFAIKWGFAPLIVTNIFAYRATDPDELHELSNAVAVERSCNNDAIIYAARHSGLVVAAWGTHGELYDRGDEVKRLLDREGVDVKCLGENADGSPKHPLYLRADTVPVPYE